MDRQADVFASIDQHFDDHLESARRLVRQPSVSLQRTGVRECADMVLGIVQDLGAGRAELAEFEDGYPILYGELTSGNPDARTLILYCLYDVMPVDDEDWVTPPFAAEIVEPERVGFPSEWGPCLIGRGASNQKGPFMCFVNAVRSMREVEGDIPVNILFVVEGEEEIASPHMGAFRDRYLEELRRADAAYFPNPYQDERGRAQFHLGTKGFVKFELWVRGGDWGGPARGGLFATDTLWVDSPAWELVKALHSLFDEDGRPRVGGFGENVRPLTNEERAHVDRLRAEFDEEATKERLGIRRFKGGRPGASYLEGFMTSPVLNIDGYSSGYTGPMIKTMLPDRAVAKMDVRLVPDMDHEDIERKIRAHLDAAGFPHVEFHLEGAYNWSKTEPSTPIVRAAVDAIEAHGLEAAIWPTAYYAAPMVFFSGPPLSLPFTDAGIGYMGGYHQANEFFAVESMRAFEKWVVTFLHRFAEGA